MNIHTPEQLRQHEESLGRKARINPSNPVVKVVRTEKYYTDIIDGLKHVLETLRGEMGSMKDKIRSKDAEITRLMFELEKWKAEAPEEVISLREITERVLHAHYPKIIVSMVLSQDRRHTIIKARQHCYYETYMARPDISLNLKAKFFGRDHSSYRHGVKAHSKLLGLGFEMPFAEIGA